MAEKTKTITIEDTTYNVEDLGPNIRRAVEMYDSWVLEEEKTTTHLLMIQSALRDMSRIIATLAQEELKKPTETSNNE